MTNEFGISRDESIRLIVRTCLENKVVDPNQIAYVLATAEHESTNFTLAHEGHGRRQALTHGYKGGTEYYGRGYVQITHVDNYEKFDRVLGLHGKLIHNLELAAQPEIAAKIMVLGMRDGLFRSHHGKPLNLDQFIGPKGVDFYSARYTVNGIVPGLPETIRAAHQVETFAHNWQKKVPALVESIRTGQIEPVSPSPVSHPSVHSPNNSRVHHSQHQGAHNHEVQLLQQQLNASGYRDAHGHALHADGDFGAHTKQAVQSLQHAHGLTQDGVAGTKTHEVLRETENASKWLQPNSADYVLYRETLAAVHRLYASTGRTPDDASERLAASLTGLAKENGLRRVDHVVLSEKNTYVQNGLQPGENVFVVQGRLDDPAHIRAHMKTQTALHSPIQESFRHLEAINISQSMRPPESSLSHPPHAISPVMGGR